MRERGTHVCRDREAHVCRDREAHVCLSPVALGGLGAPVSRDAPRMRSRPARLSPISRALTPVIAVGAGRVPAVDAGQGAVSAHTRSVPVRARPAPLPAPVPFQRCQKSSGERETALALPPLLGGAAVREPSSLSSPRSLPPSPALPPGPRRAPARAAARLGSAWLGLVRHHSAQLGSVQFGSARHGSARLDSAHPSSVRLGADQLGCARRGRARLDRLGSARLG